VAVVITRTATRAGLAATELSGHSLRAGFATEAARNAADYPVIMDQTGQENLTTVLPAIVQGIQTLRF
jgi:integrase